MFFFNTTFRKTLLFIILLELFSFAGFLFPIFNTITFIVLILLFLIICLEHLDWGVYILLAELFIGSKGYLFFYNLDGTWISIRIAFWLIIMGVWLVKKARKQESKKAINAAAAGSIVSAELWSPVATSHSGSIALRRLWSQLRCQLKLFKSKLFYYFIILFIIIGWGLLMGFIRGNSFNNIFDDFNAYLFFSLIFVFYDTIKDWTQVKQIMQVLTASLVAMSLKTIGLLYLFSHQIYGISALYKWVRTSGVGEITMMGGNYYRIFFQSHIYIIIGFIVFLIFLLFNGQQLSYKLFWREFVANLKRESFDKLRTGSSAKSLVWQYLPVIILFASVILISLSRSFWVGLIGGLVLLFVFYLINAEQKFNYKKFIIYFIISLSIVFYILFIQWTKFYLALILAVPAIIYLLIKIIKFPRKKVYIFSSLITIIFLLGLGLVNNTVKFPWPESKVDISLAELMSDRATTISGEAAVGSRWNLLPVLMKEIIKFPTILVGSGFGSTVTYNSTDPRILAKNPTGEYTTYAFEWGYLDIWYKLGIIGLVAYLILLYKIFMLGWQQLEKQGWQINDDKTRLILGLLLGLIILIIIHGFTPYLNHPLGIGYLILCAVVFETAGKQKPIFASS